MEHQGLQVLNFKNITELTEWLAQHHTNSPGIWVRIFKAGSGERSVTFQEVLEAGLCFGWSESLRHPMDEKSYLQKFTPRKTKSTASPRNLRLVERLDREGRMTPAGFEALGMRKQDADS